MSKRRFEEIDESASSAAVAREPDMVAEDVDELEEEEEEQERAKSAPSMPVSTIRIKCPYLDTINRQKLDFDQQKVCSVTLTNLNVYACLVCGKYFQGRGKSTPAYTHSVHCGHFVFINLHDTKAYCLPDNYEIVDYALNDVKHCLAPTFTSEEIVQLSRNTTLARDVYGVSYLPGFVGLNNLNKTDYLNVLLHALSHVEPLRSFFLRTEDRGVMDNRSPLVKHFGEALRKLWSRHNFKSVISPQDLMHTISTESKKRFHIGQQMEAIELYVWLLNTLARPVSTSPESKVIAKAIKGLIADTFQGEVEVRTLTRASASATASSKPGAKIIVDPVTHETWEETVSTSAFNYLSLDIPPTPLFRDSQGGLIIPQIPLFNILTKFDGSTWTDKAQATAEGLSGLTRKQYRIKKLPKYLVFHLNRFVKNNFGDEKNPTIVTFPIKNLEMKDYLKTEDSSSERMVEEEEESLPESLDDHSVHQLKLFIDDFGTEADNEAMRSLKEKPELLGLARSILSKAKAARSRKAAASAQTAAAAPQGTKYNLVANICHDSLTAQGVTVSLTTESKHVKVIPPPTTASQQQQQNQQSLLPLAATAATTNVLSNGCYRVHIHNQASGQWFEVQDLHVTEIMPQLIGLSESYMLIYERQK